MIQEVSPDGAVLVTKVAAPPFSTTQPALPVLPHPLPNAGMDKAGQPFNVAGTNGVAQFRVIDWPEDSFDGNFVVFAIPIDDVLSTLSQLFLQELFISAAVVGGTGVLALLIIQIGLRPLRRMGAVADTIAAGCLFGGVGLVLAAPLTSAAVHIARALGRAPVAASISAAPPT